MDLYSYVMKTIVVFSLVLLAAATDTFVTVKKTHYTTVGCSTSSMSPPLSATQQAATATGIVKSGTSHPSRIASSTESSTTSQDEETGDVSRSPTADDTSITSAGATPTRSTAICFALQWSYEVIHLTKIIVIDRDDLLTTTKEATGTTTVWTTTYSGACASSLISHQ